MANKYALSPFVMQTAGGGDLFVDAGSLWDSASAVVAGAPSMFTSPLTLAASGVAAVNPNPVPVAVTVSGGTVTAIAVGGVSTGLTSGTFTIEPGGSIAVTYSVAPTAFTTADIPPSAGWPGVNGVLAGYLAAYPSGPQVS